MKWFLGEYEYGIDRQRRVAIPSVWRESDRSLNRFILMPGPSQGVQVLPAGMFEDIVQKFRQTSFGDPEIAGALALIGSRGHDSICDSQGRIGLTPQLMEHAGLKPQGKAVLVGGITTIQIFAPSNWQTRPKNPDGGLAVLQRTSGQGATVAEVIGGLLEEIRQKQNTAER